MTSDNSAQLFLHKFAQTWGIELKTSSPIYPKANGLVEKSVQKCKRILSKSKDSGSNPYIALLQYHNSLVDILPHPHSYYRVDSLDLPTIYIPTPKTKGCHQVGLPLQLKRHAEMQNPIMTNLQNPFLNLRLKTLLLSNENQTTHDQGKDNCIP